MFARRQLKSCLFRARARAPARTPTRYRTRSESSYIQIFEYVYEYEHVHEQVMPQLLACDNCSSSKDFRCARYEYLHALECLTL